METKRNKLEGKYRRSYMHKRNNRKKKVDGRKQKKVKKISNSTARMYRMKRPSECSTQWLKIDLYHVYHRETQTTLRQH